MIYTKGKVGHYMGNTDILTTSLPDAGTENTTEHSTIFDDVFRTIAQKMPQLLIPLPSLRLRSPLHPVCDPVPKRRLLL